MVQGNQTDLGVSRGRFRTMLSRRGVMAAAVASAAVALTKASNPPTALAAFNLQAETSNATAATTSVSKSAASATEAFKVINASGDGIQAISSTTYGVNALGIGAGVFGATASTGGIGLWGQLFGGITNGQAVLGVGGSAIGIYGQSAGAIGVLGASGASHAIFGSALGVAASGVFGTSTNANGVGVTGSNASGIGVSASSTSSVAMFAASGSGTGVVGRSTTGKAAEFFGNVEITGDFTASGMKSAAVKVADGSVRRMYCLESPLSYFEDIGTGSITDGHGGVAIDPVYGSTVDLSDYSVFLTPNGDCRGLYIESKSSTGFSVKELMGGTSSVSFSYRIVAKRTGITNERLAPVSMSLNPQAGPKVTPQHVVEIPDVPKPSTNLIPR